MASAGPGLPLFLSAAPERSRAQSWFHRWRWVARGGLVAALLMHLEDMPGWTFGGRDRDRTHAAAVDADHARQIVEQLEQFEALHRGEHEGAIRNLEKELALLA